MRGRSPVPYLRPLIGLLVALAWSGLALPQEAGAPRPAPSVGLDTADYRLSPGDVVKVSVYREEELSGSYLIGPAGTLSMTFVDRLPAAGLTVDQLREALAEQLRTMIKRPVVQVTIDVEKSVRRVYVNGSVEKAGLLSLPFGATIAEAVVAAGVTPLSDLSAVRVSRQGQPPLVIDLRGLRGEGPLDQAQVARQGDVVFVPKFAAEFSVVGMVGKPGTYSIIPEAEAEMTVLRALNAAGGPADGVPLASGRLLHEDGTSDKIDFHALLYEGDMTQNRPLRRGDVLVIGEAGKIIVAGEVNEPGAFAVAQPVSVLEAIARAGGFTPNADLKRATIMGEAAPRKTNLEKLWWQADTTQNIEILPGETLLIPERDPEEVLVVGAVEKPGTIEIHRVRERGVLRLVETAVPKPAADLSRVTIHRAGAEAPLLADVRAAMEQGKLEGNLPVEPGDIVFVPELQKVYAIGAFGAPGVYPLTPELTLIELVARAGGFRPDALAKRVHFQRTGPAGPEVTVIDFRRIERGADTDRRLLQEGDVVFVPSRKQGGGWSAIRDVVWSAVGLLRAF